MKNEPCVRLGMRMSPKISEKPAESRNRSPPSVMLLTVRSSHRFMFDPAALPTWSRSGFERRVIARVDRLGEEPFLVIGPELAHILVGLDGVIDELAVLLLDFADIDVADDVAVVVEADRSARRIGQRHAAQRRNKGFLVVGIAAGLLQ